MNSNTGIVAAAVVSLLTGCGILQQEGFNLPGLNTDSSSSSTSCSKLT